MDALYQTNILLSHLNTIAPHAIDGRLGSIILDFSVSLENLRDAQEFEDSERAHFDAIVSSIA